MWRKLRGLAVVAAMALLAAGFLLSPWGPWSGVFFATGVEEAREEASQGALQEREADAVPGAPGAGMGEEAERDSRTSSDTRAPTVAIVVDDVGLDKAKLQEWLAVDEPLTFAALPHCVATPELAESLHAAGFRIMLHIPTENDPPQSFSGHGQLAVGMDRGTVFAVLDGDLATVPHVSGINNHQGGRGCNDLQLMTYECEWARERGLLVVDSDSSTDSQVTRAAQSLGFPRRKNQVFIDHSNQPDHIREQVRRLAAIARQEGTAIGICHFHRPNTPSVVGEMIKTLRGEGIRFAFVEDIHN